MMKAAWYDRYGAADVVEIRNVAIPEIDADEVLVKVHNSSLTTADWRLRASAFPRMFWLAGRMMFGVLAPRKRILGGDFAGRIVANGKNVTRFGEGDAVFGFSTLGAHAQYLAIKANAAIVAKPEGLSFEQAAAVPFGGLSALVFLRDFARVTPGDKVLILGASGGVGVFAVQLAKQLGADVTGLCSAANMELVRSLGADHVIDYHTTDFTRQDTQYDVILDTAGVTHFAACKGALSATGRFVPLEFGLREVWQSLTAGRRGKRVVIGVSGDTQADLEHLRDLLKRGEIRPVIDRCVALAQIVKAYRRVESRHKTGALILTVAPSQVTGQVAA